jgi:hypothetical protein
LRSAAEPCTPVPCGIASRRMRLPRLGRVLKGVLMDRLRATASKPYLKSHPRVSTAIAEVRQRNLTFLGRAALIDLAIAADPVSLEGIEGAIIETGVALGGSTIVLATAKDTGRRLAAYDTFGMIPPPSDRDDSDVQDRYAVIAAGESKGIGGDTYYGYRDDLLSEVRSSFEDLGLPPERHNVEFIQGLYEDTLVVDSPVALAHLDCDWYESVKVCLERIHPHLTIGGRFVIDDYDEWSGARTAVDEFLASHKEYLTERHARLHLVKQA